MQSLAAGAVAIGGAGSLATAGAAADGDGDEKYAVSYEGTTLPDLPVGSYEGWAIFGEEKVSTGTFSADDEYVFEVDRDLAEADRIAITVEPDDDAGGEPSGVVILAGELADGTADLSYPVSFDDAAGTFLLNTPTAPDVDGTSGIWFLEPGEDGSLSASLDLPDLPDAWTYEGWVVHEGTPITTGRFDDPAEPDESRPYSGPEEGPPFPGEDFVTNAPAGLSFPTDLTDGGSMAVVTVEPDVEELIPDGTMPFPIKPLVGEIPADGEVGTSYDLSRNPETVPSGAALLHADAEAARGIDIGEYTARDLDGDGLYRDVDGNGEFTPHDVVVFFENAEESAITENAAHFDYDGSGDVTMTDVVELFERL